MASVPLFPPPPFHFQSREPWGCGWWAGPAGWSQQRRRGSSTVEVVGPSQPV